MLALEKHLETEQKLQAQLATQATEKKKQMFSLMAKVCVHTLFSLHTVFSFTEGDILCTGNTSNQGMWQYPSDFSISLGNVQRNLADLRTFSGSLAHFLCVIPDI